MTAKDKAKELVDIYYNHYDLLIGDISLIQAKLCATIAVEEILKNNCGSYTFVFPAVDNEIYCDDFFWMDVKEKIKLI